MHGLYYCKSIRQMEQRAFAREDSFAIMQRAGNAVAAHAIKMLGKSAPQQRVLAVAGSGNNGGDAFVAAAHLRESGVQVFMLCPSLPAENSDAAKACALWCGKNGGGCGGYENGDILTGLENVDFDFDLIIDGLFGIGLDLSRPPQDATVALLQQLSTLPTLSIDLPSGIDGDSGGAGAAYINAKRTVTFFADKPGLHTGIGAQASGEVFVESLGCDDLSMADLPAADGKLLTANSIDFSRLRRRADSHKGNIGQVQIVGGNSGMFGALVLAARAAVRLGSGKTVAHYLAAAASPVVDWQVPEIMWQDARRSDFSNYPPAACLAIGPGLGQDSAAAEILQAVLQSSTQLVLDADALNLIAQHKNLSALLSNRNLININEGDKDAIIEHNKRTSILTPHPAEAARLLNCTAADINQGRIAAAKTLAKMFSAVVVLKGAGSIIADSGGAWAINSAGNPGLSQAGAGDVLTGMIAALLAQTGDALFAARAGAVLHGAAADILARNGGEIGLNLNHIAPVAARLIALANGDINGDIADNNSWLIADNG